MIPVLLGFLDGYCINYLSDVLPDSLRLGKPLCQNPACKATYSWIDYLFFLRCRNCGQRRRIRSFLVLPFSILSSLMLWVSPPTRLGYPLGLLLLSYLSIIAVIDFEHHLVLRPLSISGLILAALAGFILHNWKSTVIGAVFGFGVMFMFYLLGIHFTRWIAKKKNKETGQGEEALGSGDVTLATILGLFLGWPLIWSGLLLGALILGMVVIPVALVLLLRRRSHEMGLVFIPIGVPFILSTILLIFLPIGISGLFLK